MSTWIALLRGINVGGKNILPMKDLRALLQGLGFENVQTYIQSGNCVFSSPDIDAASMSARIKGAIQSRFGFAPAVLILAENEMREAIAANPYPQGADDPKSVHFFFLSEPVIAADEQALDAIKLASEHYTLTDKVFYLFAPDGVGRSKLAAQVERILGVATTARNLRSALKVLDLVS